MLAALMPMACEGLATLDIGAQDRGGDSQGAGEVGISTDVTAELPGDSDARRQVPDGGTDLVFDIGPDVPFVECEPGTGCFLDPCVDNGQCQSGWCVEHMGEGICSKTCQEECPPGWACKQVSGADPDVVYICVSLHSNLCKPCNAASDCQSVAGSQDVCVDYGVEGAFCGGTCTDGGDCPWGFACAESTTVDGLAATQCVADAGVCPCTDRAVEMALWTACEVANDAGVCPGKRVCTEEGLSPCDAAVPEQETCNGQDDDCDEEVDEPVVNEGEYLNLCDDGNPCSDDACKGEVGCEYLPIEGNECLDGNPCTIADHCEAGVCVGTPVDCDDDNPCSDDGCDETGGCVFEFNESDCDDGDPCTVADRCEAGDCVGFVVQCDCQEDADCLLLDDGNVCNGVLVCAMESLPFQCVVQEGSVVECPEPEGPDAPCLQPSCDSLSGDCSFVPHDGDVFCDDGDACTVNDKCEAGACTGGQWVNCNDGNSCTVDNCDAQVGCSNKALEGDCDDGNPCTLGDVCSDGVCAPTGLVDCDDANPCTKDSCSMAGGCTHETVDGACSDGDPCTLNDACQNGACVPGTDLDCGDGNPCTADSCGPDGKCLNVAMELPCDDGNKCTEGDHCDGGKCVYDDVAQCEDGNACTSDSCDPVNGCVHTLNTLPCDDGNVCTTGDHCHLGGCISAGQLICDDGNGCTDDWCNPDSGCTFAPNEEACDDDNVCTLEDQCGDGMCKGGGWNACDDSNLCTDDSCLPGAGCINAPNTLPCDDGDKCTEGEVCHLGDCLGGQDIVCDDEKVCTTDSCDPVQGCLYANNTAACDDASVCTDGDKCKDGECEPGPALDCDDDIDCTLDICHEITGCISVPGGENCQDGNECTQDICNLQSGCANPAVPDLTPCAPEGWKCVGGQCQESLPCEGGWAYKGHCWYQGPVMSSNSCPTCDTICAGHGGCHAPLVAEGLDQSCTACKATGCPNCGCQDGPGNIAAHEAAPMHNGSTCEYTDHPAYPPICGSHHCNSTVWGRRRLCPCNETP